MFWSREIVFIVAHFLFSFCLFVDFYRISINTCNFCTKKTNSYQSKCLNIQFVKLPIQSYALEAILSIRKPRLKWLWINWHSALKHLRIFGAHDAMPYHFPLPWQRWPAPAFFVCFMPVHLHTASKFGGCGWICKQIRALRAGFRSYAFIRMRMASFIMHRS